jgi:hypothetical protein
MQKPNFPNEIFRVLFQPGKPGNPPRVTVVVVPARYTQASVITASNRRISLDKLGKIETVAESSATHIVRAWVRDRESIPLVVERMYIFVRGQSQMKLEAVQNMLLGLIGEPIQKEEVYRD